MVSSGAPLPPLGLQRSAGRGAGAVSDERVRRPGLVRGPILASWWRSRQWQVAADRVELSYIRDPNLDTPLTRSAMPVLRNLYEHLDGQPISIILTDAAGVVLSRMTADHDLERRAGRGPARPGLQLRRGAGRHERDRDRAWRAASPRTCSATSTTRRTWRSSAAPGCRSMTRSPGRRSARWT